MAKQFPSLNPDHIGFIEQQKIFFIGSAAPKSRVNLSPKGTDLLRVLDESHLAYLDLTGSGNETSAHTRAGSPLTFMFCAFQGPPLILRVYGTGKILPRNHPEYPELAALICSHEPPGARQIVLLTADLVQTSCGYAVPRFAYEAPREGLTNWARGKGEEGLIAYRQEKNRTSIDGLQAISLD